jgi:hypothetical protein
MCWREGYIPEEQSVATVIGPIYKKGNIKTDNYRGISLLCAAYKWYAKIMSRISVLSEPLLDEEQNGFKRGRSSMDSIIYNSTTPGKACRI